MSKVQLGLHYSLALAFATLLFFSSNCSAAPSGDNVIPGNKCECSRNGLNELKQNITNAIGEIEKDNKQLTSTIEGILQRFISSFSPNDDIDQSSSLQNHESCGYLQICVPKDLCEEDDNERTASNNCLATEKCCLISNTKKFKEVTSQEQEITGCGSRRTIEQHGDDLMNSEIREAKAEEFPWVVAILKKVLTDHQYIGVGSILAPTVVLTLGRKVEDLEPDQLTVRAGDWNLKTDQERHPHVDRDVRDIIPHPYYSSSSRENNIALLILELRIPFGRHIVPICLPRPNAHFEQASCLVSGWGSKNSASIGYRQVLKKISLRILSRQECISRLTPLDLVNDFGTTNICAGGERNIDTCLGDGGAPLVCPIRGASNRYYQAGIVAWGSDCGIENVPGAYTNVAMFWSWITEELSRRNISSRYYTYQGMSFQ